MLDGADALLLAPTAGGKTEAAMFPLLTAMDTQRWSGLSVIYVCPLKALLNNLLPRLETYAGWLGRRVAIWHGDVSASARQRILRDPPDVLLTTPESLEAMLISLKVEHGRAVLRRAGDRRGRGARLRRRRPRLAPAGGAGAADPGDGTAHPADRPVGHGRQPGRAAGLAAGIGARAASRCRGRPRQLLVVPGSSSAAPPPGDIELDYVGSVSNAATVIASLHRGEKRLVFCDSRQLVEEIGAALRERGVTTFLSHASLPLDERHRAEQAFAEARDCVIVATSTLELGIDVGDLDRVIQVNDPPSVAAFLQRIGRTGRRPGSRRNCLFLALNHGALLWSAGLLHLWGQGYVEPVVAPPEPRHIVAQQLLALCLQEHRIGSRLWVEAWNGLAPFDRSAEPILRYLVEQGFIDQDGELLFIGPAAEQRFGHRHFMGMTAVFTAPPQFTVLAGRQEIGRTDPMLLTEKIDGPRLLLLGGRSWKVTWIDWKRRRCYVEPAEGGGKARWLTPGVSGASFALSRAAREVLLGADPPVALTQRAKRILAEVREEHLSAVHPAGTVITRDGEDVRWWTWAGYRANATLAATLSHLTDSVQRFDDASLRMRGDLTLQMWKAGTADATERLCLPDVDERALAGLKFNEALPERLATATLAARMADLDSAVRVLAEPSRFTVVDSRA